MGCSGSKQVDVAVDVYQPPPTSISLFDISKIEEPWIIAGTNNKLQEEEEEDEDLKKNQVTPVTTLPLLEKLDSSDAAPTSWNEVSKALEDLKPSIESNKTTPFPLPSKTKKILPPPTPVQTTNSNNNNTMPVVVTAATPTGTGTVGTATVAPALTATTNSTSSRAIQELGSMRPVRENSFILRDKEQKKTGSEATNSAIALWRRRRDPLEGYPEKRPAGKGGEGIVLYTTTLRGVRRTFEDCERARLAVEAYATEAGIVLEERDVSLHSEYLKEMKELAGEEAVVPRLFIRGRYIGGIEEVMDLADTGKLREMLKWVKEGKGASKDCEGCGGARFVPCFTCHGSCKVVAADGKGVERCGMCNENGLDLCPICH